MIDLPGAVGLLLAQAQPPPAGHEMSALQIIANSELVVQLTVLLLLSFSVISWAIILYKFRALRLASQETGAFLDAFWKTERLDEAAELVEAYPHAPVAQVFRAGYAELRRLVSDGETGKAPRRDAAGVSPLMMGPSGLDNVVRALRRAGTAQLTSLERRLPFLATCGSTSPFIGLFGTVWGILKAFQRIGATGSASIATVGPAISEALIATAVGLFAAIPAVIAYNYFLSRVKLLSADMDTFSSEYLNIVKRHFFKG